MSSWPLLLLFLALFALRVVHLTADPPANLDWSGGLFFDEGMLVHGARNKVLFGSWDLDEWSDFYISPILFYIKWLVFHFAGVGMAQERSIPLFFSFLTLIVFYLSFKESFDRRTALLAVVLLGFNYVFIMFNRVGLTETSLVFFMVLTAYLFQKGLARYSPRNARQGEGKRPASGAGLRRAFLFLTGVSAFVAYIFKATPYVLAVPVVALLLCFPFFRRDSRREGAATSTGWREAARAIAALGWCSLGMLLTFTIWYGAFYLRHAASINQATSYYKRQALPRSFHQLLVNLSHPPLFDYFVQTPIILSLSFLCVGYFTYLFFHNRAALRPLDAFMLSWYVMHLVQYAVLTYRPVRYYLPVVPPMCALAARAMLAWSSGHGLAIPARLSLACLPFLALWLTLFLGYGFLPLLYRLVPALRPDSTWPQQMVTAAAVAVIIIALVALLSRRWPARGFRLSPRTAAVAFLWLPLSGIVLINGYHYYRWAAHPRYVIRDVSRELGTTLHDAVIAGVGAPMIVLENTHRALHVYEGFFNYRNTFDRYPITHLFMGAFNQEVEFYYRTFGERMRRATLSRVHPIKESHFYLYSLVEPSVEAIELAWQAYRPDETLAVSLTVRNNEPARPREVKPGWILRRLDAPSGSRTVTASSSFVLKPGETREITVAGEVTCGIYRLMGFPGLSYENVFEAEFLSHRLGEREDDREASNGEAWRVRQADQTRGFAVFGPYVRYPPGSLRVFFRLKTSDNRVESPVAQIDVVAEGRKLLAIRQLRGLDFPASRSYEDFELSAFLDDLHRLEFRVVSHKRTDIWVDRIRVEFARGEWYRTPITVGAPAADPASTRPCGSDAQDAGQASGLGERTRT